MRLIHLLWLRRIRILTLKKKKIVRTNEEGGGLSRCQGDELLVTLPVLFSVADYRRLACGVPDNSMATNYHYARVPLSTLALLTSFGAVWSSVRHSLNRPPKQPFQLRSNVLVWLWCLLEIHRRSHQAVIILCASPCENAGNACTITLLMKDVLFFYLFSFLTMPFYIYFFGLTSIDKYDEIHDTSMS